MSVVRAIRVSAVVLTNADGEILTVRKRGTTRFMLPGGKPEPGEEPHETAMRECREEVGVDLEPERLRYVGLFRAAAANEPGVDVEAHVYAHPCPDGVVASAEIAELRWLDPAALPLPSDLAPMLVEGVLPAIA